MKTTDYLPERPLSFDSFKLIDGLRSECEEYQICIIDDKKRYVVAYKLKNDGVLITSFSDHADVQHMIELMESRFLTKFIRQDEEGFEALMEERT